MQLHERRTTLCIGFDESVGDKHLKSVGNSAVRKAANIMISALAVGLLMTTAVDARVVPGVELAATEATPYVIAQRGCMSLSQAVDSIRRSGNVERVISAETRGDTHHIKVLTKDGKVRTHRVPAC